MSRSVRILLLSLAWHQRMHFTHGDFQRAFFNIAVRSDRLCTLVAGLLDAFVTAYNLQRTNRGMGLLFRELMYGRIKMMLALWAHTYQTMCLEFHPEQLRPEAFRPPKPKKHFP